MLFGDIASSWRIYDPIEEFNLDLNNVTTLQQYNTIFESIGDFGAFIAFEFGFDKYFREIIGRYIIMPFYMRAYDSNFMKGDLCAMMWW